MEFGDLVRLLRNSSLAVVFVAVLSACGADGEPVQPTLNAGVSVGTGGVHVGGGIGLSSGPVSLLIGF